MGHMILWNGNALRSSPPEDTPSFDSEVDAADDEGLHVLFVQDSRVPLSGRSILSTAPAIIPIPADAGIAMSLPGFPVASASSILTPASDAPLPSTPYGRYVGRIDARIERAWLRPRIEIGASLFSCFVQIEQDAHGLVQEVTLERCNGNERWQRSLVLAIESVRSRLRLTRRFSHEFCICAFRRTPVPEARARMLTSRPQWRRKWTSTIRKGIHDLTVLDPER